MNAIRSYSYKPKFLVVLLAIAFFLACALFMGYEALYDDRGVIIDSLIELGPEGAKVLYALLALLSCGMVVYAVLAARASLWADRSIVIASDHVSIPDSILSRKGIDIPFTDITGLTLQVSKRIRILRIQHKAGITKATQRFFEDKDHFDDFLAQMQRGVQATQLSTA